MTCKHFGLGLLVAIALPIAWGIMSLLQTDSAESDTLLTLPIASAPSDGGARAVHAYLLMNYPDYKVIRWWPAHESAQATATFYEGIAGLARLRVSHLESELHSQRELLAADEAELTETDKGEDDTAERSQSIRIHEQKCEALERTLLNARKELEAVENANLMRVARLRFRAKDFAGELQIYDDVFEIDGDKAEVVDGSVRKACISEFPE